MDFSEVSIKEIEESFMRITNYRTIPNFVIDYVMRSGMSDQAFSLYIYLLRSMHSQNKYSMQICRKETSKATNRSIKSVQRGLNEIQAYGFIEKAPFKRAENKSVLTLIKLKYPEKMLKDFDAMIKGKTLEETKGDDEMTVEQTQDLNEYLKKYKIDEAEKHLLVEQMKVIAVKHEWDKSIVCNVIKEIVYAVTDGDLAHYNGDRFERIRKALVIVNDGRWTSPDHFMDELDKQHEAYQEVKRHQMNQQIDPKVMDAMIKGLAKSKIITNDLSGYDH